MSRSTWPKLVIALALMAGAAVFLWYRQHHQHLGIPGVKVVAEPVYDADGKVACTNSVALPVEVSDYRSEPQPITRLVLDWLPKDTVYGQRLYKGPDGFEILVNVVLMGGDRTSIHKPQYCLQGTGWTIEKSELASVSIPEPFPYDLPVMKLSLSRAVEEEPGRAVIRRGYYVYWFVADQQLTADHNERMWWMTRDLIRSGVMQRWAYVVCFAVCPPGREESTCERLSRFIGEAVPRFQTATGRPAGATAGKAPPKLAGAAGTP